MWSIPSYLASVFLSETFFILSNSVYSNFFRNINKTVSNSRVGLADGRFVGLVEGALVGFFVGFAVE